MAATAKRPTVQKSLVTLVSRSLRPVARIALQHCMSCLEFEEIARWVFVDLVLHDPAFALQGRNKQFKSRAAILTGLSRKEVMRLARQLPPGERDDFESRNRAARVLAGWFLPPFADGKGLPRPLSLKDGSDSFERLVRTCGGDVPHRAILDELLNCGAVEKLDGGRVRLKSVSRLFARSPQEALDRAASSLDGMFGNIERQLRASNGSRRRAE